jgi:hypothetical protein
MSLTVSQRQEVHDWHSNRETKMNCARSGVSSFGVRVLDPGSSPEHAPRHQAKQAAPDADLERHEPPRERKRLTRSTAIIIALRRLRHQSFAPTAEHMTEPVDEGAQLPADMSANKSAATS